MRAYVINLPRLTERRALMQQQLEASGLEYEFVEGVDGAALTPAERATLVDEAAVREFPEWLTPKAIGCSLSHKRVYDRVVADRVSAALVLEDDALLDTGVKPLTERLARELQPDEVMLLNFRSLEPCQLTRTGATVVGEHQLLRPLNPRQPISGLAYLVGADAAASLADSVVPVRIDADSWGERLEAGVIGSLRVVLPRPVGHNPRLESSEDYSTRSSARRWVKRSSARVIPGLRAANRRRVERRMSRFRLVD